MHPSSTAKSSNRESETVSVHDVLVMPQYVDALRSAGLDSLDAMFNVKNAELLTKPGLGHWRERLRFELDHEGQRRIFYMKRFTSPPAQGRREAAEAGNGARSVAGVEWKWMRQLAADGIPCAQPVAFGEDIHRWREVRSAVVMEAVPGESLERWAGSLTSPSGERRGEGAARDHRHVRRLLGGTCRLVAKFHAGGYVHRDLYLAHIFFDPHETNGAALRLIDLQRVFRPTFWASRWIVKDLAALNYSTPRDAVSRADRLRWLKCYLQLRESLRSTHAHTRSTLPLKRLALRVLGKTQEIARHDRRRSRVKEAGE